jgi:ribonucleotide monophosphatase NagD (HAD superfamily)
MKAIPIPKKKRPAAPKATIAIDFDGVLADPVTKKPLPDALDTMDFLANKGFRLIIFSARATSDVGRQTIIEWCQRHMVRVSEVTGKKPMADLYIDDKAIHHTSWMTTTDEIAARLGMNLT